MPDFVRPLNLKKPIVNRKLIAWGFILTGLVSVGSWAWGRTKQPQPPVTSGAGTKGIKEEGGGWWGSVKITYTVTPPTPSPANLAIVAQLQSQIATASGQYSIYVYRLTDKVGYGISADKTLKAASIMKVPIMVATYRKVEEGTLQLKDVQDLLQAMGKVSDNDAPVTLSNLVGRDFVQQTINSLGMTNTDFSQNTTTAYDLAAMWRNLYEGKLVNQADRDQMWKFLSDSIFEDRIAAGVPDGVQVIHKVGTDLDVWSDTGIVMGKRPFVVVIVNQGVNIAEATKLVPGLVKTIWNGETAGQ